MGTESDSYFVVFKWMVEELGLSGTDLNIFAIIYGFSQTKTQEYTGGGQYLGDFCGVSRRTVTDSLNRLVEKKLITKREEVINGVKYCRYKSAVVRTGKTVGIGEQNLPGGMEESAKGYSETCQGGMEESANNTIVHTLLGNIEDNSSISKDINNHKTLTETKQPSGSTMSEANADVLKKKRQDLSDRSYLAEVLNTSDEVMINIMIEFIKHRKALGKPLNDYALKRLVSKLKPYEDSVKVEMIQQSIDNCWLGVFPINQHSNVYSNSKKPIRAGEPRRINHNRYADPDGSQFTVSFMHQGNQTVLTKMYDDGRRESIYYKTGNDPTWIE